MKIDPTKFEVTGKVNTVKYDNVKQFTIWSLDESGYAIEECLVTLNDIKDITFTNGVFKYIGEMVKQVGASQGLLAGALIFKKGAKKG